MRKLSPKCSIPWPRKAAHQEKLFRLNGVFATEPAKVLGVHEIFKYFLFNEWIMELNILTLEENTNRKTIMIERPMMPKDKAKIVGLFAFFCLTVICSSNVSADEYQVIFFCGAGGVKISDCIKDARHIREKTGLPIKLFVPGGKVGPIRSYVSSDLVKQEKFIRDMVKSQPNVHPIFITSSQGYIPFSYLAPKLKDLGIKDQGYDVILNQPAGPSALVPTGLIPRPTLSFDKLLVRPRSVVNFQAPDWVTSFSFHEPKVEFSGDYHEIRYGPLTDLGKEKRIRISPLRKHSISTGVGLQFEVPDVISILSTHSNDEKKVGEISTQIDHVLLKGREQREMFWKKYPGKLEKMFNSNRPSISGTKELSGVSMGMDVDASSIEKDNSGEQESLKNDILNSRPTSE